MTENKMNIGKQKKELARIEKELEEASNSHVRAILEAMRVDISGLGGGVGSYLELANRVSEQEVRRRILLEKYQ